MLEKLQGTYKAEPSLGLTWCMGSRCTQKPSRTVNKLIKMYIQLKYKQCVLDSIVPNVCIVYAFKCF